MTREINLPGFLESIVWSEDGTKEIMVLDFVLAEDQAGITVAVSGSATATIDEDDVVAGTKQIIEIVTGDTWVSD